MPAPLIAALRHLLRQSVWARDRLQPYAGSRALLALGPLETHLEITAEGLVEKTDASDLPADVTIRLPADTPFRLLQGGAAEAMKSAHISGSADFAEALGFVLRHLRWDAEEDLSHWIGDIAAHRLVAGAKAAFHWQKEAVQRLGENLSEYATLENPTLLGKPALAEFRDQLSAFQAQLDAAERRSRQLGK